MTTELVERTITALFIGGMIILAYILLNRRALKQAKGQLGNFEGYRLGLPALIYFTTPTCIPCKTVQRPIIERIKARMGNWLQVIEIDASLQPDVAREWGVVSVPTTFVIDRHGKPRHVNHGVVSVEKLVQQLELEDEVI